MEEKTKRYFIVFYMADDNFYGVVPIVTDGSYLNAKKTLEDISKARKNAMVTAINELSKSDFEDWINI